MNQQEIIEKTELKVGKHSSFTEGSCVMELVSYLANEPWSDNPQCACPVLTKFAIRLNDKFVTKFMMKLTNHLRWLVIFKTKGRVRVKYEV